MTHTHSFEKLSEKNLRQKRCGSTPLLLEQHSAAELRRTVAVTPNVYLVEVPEGKSSKIVYASGSFRQAYAEWLKIVNAAKT